MSADVINIKNGPLNRLKGPTLFLAFVGAAFFLAILGATWKNIRPGYVGIVFDKANHKVTAGRLEPGWAFVNPLTQAIQEYPITIQTYSMVGKATEGQTRGDDSIKIQSNEGQQVNVDVVIQYQVIKEEAGLLYQDWGGAGIYAVEDGIIRQYTRSLVPVSASRYGWEEITSSKRGQIVQEISEELSKEFAARHLRLISFGIREVHLPASLQSALDQKIQAQQAAEQQRYQLKQAEVRAQQDVTEATGKANAMKAQAEGEAAAIFVRAEAQAKANDLLAKSISDQLISYQQVQRWDGILPQVSGGGVPLLNLNKSLSGHAP